nr:Nbc34 [Streptomyces sp.]
MLDLLLDRYSDFRVHGSERPSSTPATSSAPRRLPLTVSRA